MTRDDLCGLRKPSYAYVAGVFSCGGAGLLRIVERCCSNNPVNTR